jgi:alpha-beta hydrolase superfamily lysophospholipase
MTAPLLLLAALACPAGHPRLIERGGDPAPGLLVNETPGARPFDPVDPSRPTLVVVHGVNLTPRLIHFPVARRTAEAFTRRGGRPPNVFAWDWNGAARISPSPAVNDANAVDQGRRLAAALIAAGLPPERVHLIGQSSGAIVAASAAACLRAATGRAVAQITLLDPATLYHDVVFDRLAVGACAARVENVWAPGATGFGRAVGHAGVVNVRVDAPTAWLTAVDPNHSAHLHAARWYIGTVEDPARPGGFNASVFAPEVR